uniref:Transmembrane protein 39A n=1 Tax=Plectus sambesii TaxID=2011161 RepID=A0A914V2U9_9BILA
MPMTQIRRHHNHHQASKHGHHTRTAGGGDEKKNIPLRTGANQVEQSFSGAEISGLSLVNHPAWPDLPQGQGELFFECVLFLYSVLALFLQYLNLYKTLWWLPNSHWHYSIKVHLIDPHLLSCVGLLLGLRVTKCFWTTVTDMLSPGPNEKAPSYLKVVEWGFVKIPMTVAVISSFLFSFVRVVNTFPITSLLYLAYPVLVFVFLFYNELLQKLGHSGSSQRSVSLVDADSVAHMCTQSPLHIREEVDVLVADLFLRLKHCFFAAFSTSYLAVYIPCVFAPATLDVDKWWCGEMVLVVALTSFGLYMTYLLPTNYCDLLHRSASHLGAWEAVDKSSPVLHMPHPSWSESETLWPEGTIVKHGRSLYKARGATTVAAEPGNNDHLRFFTIAGDPLTIIHGMCLFQCFLIVAQFLMLIHTVDWQHIVTLVLLLFANYLLLAKVFKDKIIIGRIYHPSPEDEALMRSFGNQ